ncbi:MAG TPA: Flp pilus assembly protein CpaB [Actinomycetota bacterium]|nr:Flp pilus assembly protein CpaB [Actinomycetota bacterium]
MKPRGLAMAVALLLAVGATSAIFLYVQGVKKEAKPAANNVTIIVSKKNITAGTKLDTLIQEGQFTTVSIPRNALVDGAVTTLAELQGQTTASFILQGEQIVRARLQGSTQSTGGVFGTRDGYQAVAVQLESQRVVGGFVQAGDHVVLYTTLDNKAGVSFTATLVPDVRVLKIGDSSGAGKGGNNLVTLELKPVDAAKVILAQEQAHVWLALLPPDQQGLPQPPVTISQLAK